VTAVWRGSPPDVALQLGREAALIVCDRGYLKHQRVWRHQVARQAGCRVVQVESDVVVPVEAASGKAEIGARTLHPKSTDNLTTT
jgi:deoxyribodipyrimidine photo-lyase